MNDEELKIVISAETNPLLIGLNKATAAVKSFSSGMASNLSSASSALNKMMGPEMRALNAQMVGNARGITTSFSQMASGAKLFAMTAGQVVTGTTTASNGFKGLYGGMKLVGTGAWGVVINGARGVATATTSLGQVVQTGGSQIQGFGGKIQNLGNTLKGSSSNFTLMGAAAGATAAVTNGAMGLISSSVQGAVQRIDTLKSGPIIFKQLGAKGNEASKAMRTLNKSFDGMPVSIDTMVKATANYMGSLKSLNGDQRHTVDYAQKVATGFQFMGMSAGTSSEDVALASIQMQQAISKGKFEMEDFRSIVQRMPGPMQKITDHLMGAGHSADELRVAIRDGIIPMSDFTDALAEASDKNSEFAKNAKENSMTIGGGWSYIKTQVTKGITAMITGTSDFEKQGKAGGEAAKQIYKFGDSMKDMIPVIAQFGQGLAAGFQQVADVIGPVIGQLSKFAKWLGLGKTNSEAFGKGLAFVVSALVGMQIAGIVTGQVGGLVKSIGGIYKVTGGAIKGIGNMGTWLLNLGSKSKKAGNDTEGAGKKTKAFGDKNKEAGDKSKSASKGFSSFALNALAIGAGVGLAAAGLGAMALGFTQLAKTGDAGLKVIGAVTLGVSAMVAVVALSAGALTAGAVGVGVFGAAMLAVGTGIGIAAAGLSLLVTALTGFVSMMASANLSSVQMTNNFKVLGSAMAVGLIQAIETVISALPGLTTSFLQAMVGMLEAVITYTPQLIEGFITLITQIIMALTDAVPTFAAAVSNWIVAMLNAIAENAPNIIAAFVNMVVEVLGALTDGLPKLVKAGADFIVSLLEGIADNIGRIIDAAVDVIVKFIGGIANNLGRIIDAGIDLLKKFIMGIVNAIPQLADTAMQAVEKFVYGVGYTLGRVLSSGGELIRMFIQGIMAGVGGSSDAGNQNGMAVLRAVSNINLLGAGRAIIDGFLRGMRAAYENVKSFVSGIKGWIEAHKGPVSADRKALIPAGKAFMIGLNKGLQDEFMTVKNTVSSMSTAISDAMQPGASGSYDISSTFASGAKDLQASMSHEVAVNTQPAYINLSLGGQEYRTFVADISTQQGRQSLRKGIR